MYETPFGEIAHLLYENLGTNNVVKFILCTHDCFYHPGRVFSTEDTNE